MALLPSNLKIEPFGIQDLNVIPGLQPEGWPNILPSIEFYCKSHFCFPLKASLNGTVIGIGTLIKHGYTAWLAHIIVSPDYRSSGIGTAITKALIDLSHKNSCRTLLLIATALGEPVYRKLGFEVAAKYIFFQREHPLTTSESPEIFRFQKKYERALFQLDDSVSGEDRKELLQEHLNHSLLFVEDDLLKGFFLPSLGEGLIIADSPAAGLALMRSRAASADKFCIPKLNEHGVNFLNQHGFAEYRQGSRMILGHSLPWDGSKIYSRIGGNLG